MLVTLSIAANSVAQELLFRGYMLQTIEAHSNRALAVAVSAVLFMAAHGGALLAAGIIPAANLLVAGILLGIAFTVARNLWLPIGLHFGWNFLQGPGLGLPVSGQDIHGGVALMQTTLTGPPAITEIVPLTHPRKRATSSHHPRMLPVVRMEDGS